MIEDEMVRWNHWLNGHEFEQAPGDSEGQGSLACCTDEAASRRCLSGLQVLIKLLTDVDLAAKRKEES